MASRCQLRGLLLQGRMIQSIHSRLSYISKQFQRPLLQLFLHPRVPHLSSSKMLLTVFLSFLLLVFADSAPQAPSSDPSSLYTSRQYQSKDAFGRASFGYSHPGQSADAYLDPKGNQVGSYAYIDPDGKEVRVSYVADEKGFRIVPNKAAARSDTVSPSGFLLDTPEVAAARSAHLAALTSARAQQAALKEQVPLQQSWEVIQQTSDTPGEQINVNTPAKPIKSAQQRTRAPIAQQDESSKSQGSESDFLRSFLLAASKAFEQTEK